MTRFREMVGENGYFERNRKQQQVEWMYNNIHEELKQLFYSDPAVKKSLKLLEEQIVKSRISPVKAAERIISEFKEKRRID